jgi:hypothetical protein
MTFRGYLPHYSVYWCICGIVISLLGWWPEGPQFRYETWQWLWDKKLVVAVQICTYNDKSPDDGTTVKYASVQCSGIVMNHPLSETSGEESEIWCQQNTDWIEFKIWSKYFEITENKYIVFIWNANLAWSGFRNFCLLLVFWWLKNVSSLH